MEQKKRESNFSSRRRRRAQKGRIVSRFVHMKSQQRSESGGSSGQKDFRLF